MATMCKALMRLRWLFACPSQDIALITLPCIFKVSILKVQHLQQKRMVAVFYFIYDLDESLKAYYVCLFASPCQDVALIIARLKESLSSSYTSLNRCHFQGLFDVLKPASSWSTLLCIFSTLSSITYLLRPQSTLNKPSRHCQIGGEFKIPFNKKLLHLKLGTCYLRIEEPICHTCNVPNDITHLSIVKNLISRA
jgi:hypothetical protein